MCPRQAHRRHGERVANGLRLVHGSSARRTAARHAGWQRHQRAWCWSTPPALGPSNWHAELGCTSATASRPRSSRRVHRQPAAGRADLGGAGDADAGHAGLRTALPCAVAASTATAQTLPAGGSETEPQWTLVTARRRPAAAATALPPVAATPGALRLRVVHGMVVDSSRICQRPACTSTHGQRCPRRPATRATGAAARPHRRSNAGWQRHPAPRGVGATPTPGPSNGTPSWDAPSATASDHGQEAGHTDSPCRPS